MSSPSIEGLAAIERNVIKSPEDKRDYCAFELANGMRALAISDPITDKSAAALNVHVGSMSDPWELPGLAHFLEHMLFLGTEKFPVENEYHRFLNDHSGSFNAYTSVENTNFFFDVSPKHLSGALDRFSQFFIGPLFTESATEREINAVNSENEKNLKNDGWRLMQLEKLFCDQKHPYSRFTTGNRKCLLEEPSKKGINLRQQLLDFHAKYYSANIMSFVVLGKESIDELINMTVSMFRDVPNKNVTIPSWFDQHPLSEPFLKKRVFVVPVKDRRSLNILWPIPDYHDQYKSAPGNFIAHLLGHEAEGSLLSELKARGWVNTLVAGPNRGARGFDFFTLSVDLSDTGVNHVDDIIELGFQYLNMLRKECFQKWIFDEKRALNNMHFRFKGKETPIKLAPSLSPRLRLYPMSEALFGPYCLEEFSPDLVAEVLGLLTPDRMKVMVIGMHLESKATETEKWYGTKYSSENIPEATLERFRNCGTHENLRLPSKNDFIPENFDLKPREPSEGDAPEILLETKLMRVWFKQDDKFKLPKVFVTLYFKTPFAYCSPQTCCMSWLFCSLFNDMLTEFSYNADLAGLHFEAVDCTKGFKLIFSGYNDKMCNFIRSVLHEMVAFKPKQDRFDNLRDVFERELKNHAAQQPVQHTVYYTSMLLDEMVWSVEEKIVALPDVTLERLQRFLPQLLSHFCVEGLVYGNCTRQDACEITEMVETVFTEHCQTTPLPPKHLLPWRELMLPEGSHHVFQTINSCHPTSALSMYFQCNLQNVESTSLLDLLTQILFELTFKTLRTDEQLGYIVNAGIRRSHSLQGLRIVVQSDRRPDFLEERVESFLVNKAKSLLVEMSDEEFETNRQSLYDRYMDKPKQLASQNATYWGEINQQHYFFNRHDTLAEHVMTITRDQVLNFFNTLISPESTERKVLSVHNISESTFGKELPLLEDSYKGTVVEGIAEFRRKFPLSPLVSPAMPIGGGSAKL